MCRRRDLKTPWEEAVNSEGLVSLLSLLLVMALLAVCLLSTFSSITRAVGSGDFLPPMLNSSGIYSGAVPPPYYEVIATVTSMIDGDTTWVRIEDIVVELDPAGEVYEGARESVRYGGGVDAPETWTDPPEPGSYEATEFVEDLIPPGTTVYLDLDNVARGGQTFRPYRGTYERLIGVIYTVIDGRWINVNAELLRWGQEEYPDHDWLRYIAIDSEFDGREWLEDDYPYVRDFVEFRDVLVSVLPDEDTGAPGENVTFTVLIKNTGNVWDTYDLVVGDNAGWNPVLTDDLFEHVAPDHVKTTTLTVAIPADAENCTRDCITVTVTSRENSEVSGFDSCTAHVVVTVTGGVEVSISPENKTGLPSETLTFAVTVTNTGRYADNYDLVVTGDAGWGATLSENVLLNVEGGASGTVTLSVIIPEEAAPGTKDNIIVTATSQTDLNISDFASCMANAGKKSSTGFPLPAIAVGVVVIGGVGLVVAFLIKRGVFHLSILRSLSQL